MGPQFVRAGALVALGLLSGCGNDSPRQTVLRFSSAESLSVPTGATLRLELWRAGERQHEAGRMLGPEPFEEDTKLVVNAEGGDASRRFTVFAELLDERGARLSWARVRTGFSDSQELAEVRIVFASECPPPSDREGELADALRACGSHDTCLAEGALARCAPACLEPEPFEEILRSASEPMECGGDDCQPVERLDSGGANTCALAAGELYCWGVNGFASELPRLRRPSRVLDEDGRAGAQPAVRDFVVNERHVCLVDENGAIRCGGRNDNGQLGISSNESTACCTVAPVAPRVTSIVTGGGWVGALNAADGRMWYSGADPFQGGIEGENRPPFRPYMRAGDGYERLVSGRHFVAGFRDGALVWTGGPPDPVPSFPQTGAIRLFGAQLTLCAIDDADGSLRCWGDSVFRDFFPEPPRVFEGAWRSISLGKVEATSGGQLFVQHRCGVRTDGTLWCWGNNANGQLGREPFAEPLPFEAAVQVGSATDWADVSVGRAHTCALRDSGEVQCFGAESEGQLGSESGRVCVPAW